MAFHKHVHANGLLLVAGTVAHHLPTDADPELREVADAWPDLPPAVKAGILAMVKACEPQEDRQGVGEGRNVDPVEGPS